MGDIALDWTDWDEADEAREFEALAKAHTHLEAVNERLAAGRPADCKS